MRRLIFNLKSEEGFSLLGILISLGLLSIGLTAFVSFSKSRHMTLRAMNATDDAVILEKAITPILIEQLSMHVKPDCHKTTLKGLSEVEIPLNMSGIGVLKPYEISVGRPLSNRIAKLCRNPNISKDGNGFFCLKGDSPSAAENGNFFSDPDAVIIVDFYLLNLVDGKQISCLDFWDTDNTSAGMLVRYSINWNQRPANSKAARERKSVNHRRRLNSWFISKRKF